MSDIHYMKKILIQTNQKQTFYIFLKDSMQVLFSSYPSAYKDCFGSTQRAAQNPSVVLAKERIITTKHHQTLAQAAFNFQINDHHELLQSFPSVAKKKAKCFCLFLV